METAGEENDIMQRILMCSEDIMLLESDATSTLTEGKKQCQWMEAEWQRGCKEQEKLKSEALEMTEEAARLEERRAGLLAQWTKLLESLDRLKLENRVLLEELEAEKENDQRRYRMEWQLLSKCMAIQMRWNKDRQELLAVFLEGERYGGILRVPTEGKNPAIVAGLLWDTGS